MPRKLVSVAFLSALCAAGAAAQPELEENPFSGDEAEPSPPDLAHPEPSGSASPEPSGSASSEPVEGQSEEPASDEELPPPPEPEASDPLQDVADAFEEVVDSLHLQIHGFASQGFLITAYNNYLAHSRSGSFEIAEAGVNVTSQPLDNLRLGVQFFARDLGPIGNYSMKLDWFYLDYRLADWLGIRAGRTKIPFGLYNEVNDIDVARVPILLPQSTYPITSRDFLLAQTGAEIYGRIPMSVAGTLDYRFYTGTIFIDLPAATPGSTFQTTSIQIPYVVGGRLLWETPLEGLRTGASVQALRLDSTFVGPAGMGSVYINAILWVASLEYARDDLLLAAEYGRWHVQRGGSDPMFASDTASERAHAMASYRFATWFYPGIYYSLLYNNADIRTGRAAQQHDWAFTLRVDINENLVAKLEWHYVHGTGGLSSTLNDNVPLSMLAENWGIFIAKLTGYF
jgi:hypothetical protein